nr:MAG TPA: hypothetical protein [Caudoviricetes sp.]DAS38872.1 MAG TPA: hypothetical protein [Caudoviricetes sp.]
MWYWGHTGLRRALIGRCVQKQHNRKKSATTYCVKRWVTLYP